MNNIMFRGKSKHNNKWYYGYLGYSNSRKEYYIFEDIISFPCPISKESIGQFVKIEDNDSKDVYTGDIVTNGREYAVITFENGAIKAMILGRSDSLSIFLQEFDCTYTFKVIGNITDNPELLEKEF